MRLAVRASASNAPANTPAEQQPRRVVQPAAGRQLITNRRQLLGLGVGAAAAGCLCCPQPAAADGAGGAPWAYSCVGPACGPYQWEGACAAGVAQSPIDIPFDARYPPKGDKDLVPLNPAFPRYIKEGATVINTGHGTMQVNMPEGIEYELAGQQHRLLQFHFHAPTEHTFSGRHLAMEAHLVHKNLESGGFSVLGVMIEHGSGNGWLPNPCVAEALKCAPPKTGVAAPLQTPISLRSLLPPPRNSEGRRPYATYKGSLTTPPCSTGVEWYVFLDPLKVEGDQILEFMFFAGGGKRLGTNARPVQPLVDRKLRYFI